MTDGTFYSKFKSECQKQKISMSAVLDQNGLSRGNLKRWKDGVMPKYETIRKIANNMNIPISVFLPDSDIQELELRVSEVAKLHPDSDVDKIRESVYSFDISDTFFCTLSDAEDEADKQTVLAMGEFADSYFKNTLLECFKYLNRRGKIEAVWRLRELTENPRFQKQK